MIFIGLYIVLAIVIIIKLFILTGRAIHSVNCTYKNEETAVKQTIDIEKKMVYHDGKLIKTHYCIKRGE